MTETKIETNFEYAKQAWRERSPAKRRPWKIFLTVLSVVWLAGTITAFFTVAGVAKLGVGGQLVFSLIVGPFGLLWGVLKSTGAIEESVQNPNLYWLLLVAINGGIMFIIGKLLFGEPNQETMDKRTQEMYDRAQGRLPADKMSELLRIQQGIATAQIEGDKGEKATVGLDYESSEGHMLVVGPTRSGKGLHLTQTLLTWPGAVIVVDPKGEQYKRTAGERKKRFGSPIYRLPGNQVHLAYYYDYLLDRDAAFELHNHLLRPWQSRERIFADKSRSLFLAAAEYGKAHDENALRILLDAAESDPVAVLSGLESVPAAKKHVRLFTDGKAPSEYHENRFATSAYGTFTTMLSGYQKHIETIAPYHYTKNVIPREWAEQGATIYITYSLADLQGAGGVVAATLAALMRYQMQVERKDRILVAIDELPAIGLQNVSTYLATVGGYGITMLLYAQAISQLHELYGREGTQSILANCVHQVWYPPSDVETAKVMSELYGTAYKATQTSGDSRRYYQGGEGQNGNNNNYVDRRRGQGWEIRPALSSGEMMSLSKDKVLVLMQKDRQYRFLADRLNLIHLFDQFAPPPASRVTSSGSGQSGERRYTDWSAVLPTQEVRRAEEESKDVMNEHDAVPLISSGHM